MTLKYQVNEQPKNINLTAKIQTECGEKIAFYIGIHENKTIESIKFENKGSQLISHCANLICKTLANSKITNPIDTEKNIWQTIEIKLIGSRKEIIKKIIKDLIDQIQNFS
jgi:NifU-like protein involved in Fe-S cluster formation